MLTKEKKLQANKEQELAINTIKSGENVFLTGSGGVGKSWVIQQVMTPFSMIVAPTGIAALNVQGSTCHSAFHLPIGIPRRVDEVNISKAVKQRFNTNSPIDRIIIDEVSMLRADMLDLINKKLQKVRNNKKPFGGIQMVVVGDFFQLPPIVSENEIEHFYEKYETAFAFGAECWNFKRVELTQVVRQSDTEQINYLNAIRKGRNIKDSLKAIRDISVLEYNENTLHLCCYNNDASVINKKMYYKINSPEKLFKADISDKWGKEQPVPNNLRVKVGMKVILAANNPNQGYVNGDKGVVVKIEDDIILVKLDSTGWTVKVEMFTWEKYSYTKNGGSLEKQVVATYEQFPIKYGWAVSIHKSQGMTLDGVIIDVGKGCFTHGQLYVALSRVKDLRNIHLMNDINEEDVIVEQEVKDFYETN